MERHLPLPFPENENYATALIYFSQIAQAMATKVETELYRSLRDTPHRTMGALYWQLNDVWVAPSWSSIDFYGNWKVSRNFISLVHRSMTAGIHTIFIHSVKQEKKLKAKLTLKLIYPCSNNTQYRQNYMWQKKLVYTELEHIMEKNKKRRIGIPVTRRVEGYARYAR